MSRNLARQARIVIKSIRAAKSQRLCELCTASRIDGQSQRGYATTPSPLHKTQNIFRMAEENDLTAMRKPYNDQNDVFTEDDLVSLEPFANFQSWFEIACNTQSILEPNAMSLATASKDGVPSVRVVLMKGFSKEGIKFYTNYESRKGRDITENPNVSLNFYWTCNVDHKTNWSRQIRIEGKAERLTQEESTNYFNQRPRGSQIGACVSRQSTPIASRQTLIDKEKDLETQYPDGGAAVPKPSYWGGFLVVPHRFEFWQGQTSRIHDRIVFRRPRDGETLDPAITKHGDEGWVYERLSP